MIQLDRVLPDFLQPMGKPVHVPLGHRLAHVLLDDPEQIGVALLAGRHLGIRPAAGEEQDFQRARRVEPLDAARIDRARRVAGTGGREGPRGFLANAAEVEHRPIAADLDDRLAGAHRVFDGRFDVRHWRD